MDYVRKIPLLLGIGAALLIGFIGYASGVPNRDNTINIILGMAIFYFAGIFIRSTIKNIIEQTVEREKKKKEEEEKLEQERKQEEEKKQRELEKANQPGGKVDLVADDNAVPGMDEEDFDALPVADFIKKELK